MATVVLRQTGGIDRRGSCGRRVAVRECATRLPSALGLLGRPYGRVGLGCRAFVPFWGREWPVGPIERVPEKPV
ncbi:unnamed protein product [Pelagomonas calceolata]|uniref:Uncharacterized protein n=1 Tax=Pelagomonas calceolata TaxID=35677 RepID=A0A8J2X177_9STRA|nr:unnamed protein product [Pelagomonas calceolata]